MKTVDLRSDTVTLPSPEMWEMVKTLDNSKLGDDVLGEDPTVNLLESKAAKLMGKEAALLVTSGTQGNLVSLLSHTRPGDEILVEESSHIHLNEVGSAARIAGVMTRTYTSQNGVPSIEDLQSKIRDRSDIHEPPSTLLCTENTHNYHGGTIIKPSDLKALRKFADLNELKFHMDGARIFNAAVGLDCPVSEFTQHVDSVMFCLSKGLSCPVGSIVAGSQEFINKAIVFRKMLGGGMRQAGIIAAFGLVALEPAWIKRLNEDHQTTLKLSEGLKALNLPLSVQRPDTNILMINFPDGFPMEKLVKALSVEGVLSFNIGQKLRLVTHYPINEEDIDYCISKFEVVLKKLF